MRHLTQFLPALGRCDAHSEYVVLVRESFPKVLVSENILLERVSDNACESWGRRIVSDVVNLPGRLRNDKFSAVVSLTNIGPVWSPIPHILFQRNALYYCPPYLERIRGLRKVETALRRRLAVESMKRAELIVTPSHAMADMIRETCPEVRTRKFMTLYHGLDPQTPRGRSLPPQNPDGPILFFPSHLGEFKGYRLLFEAVALIKERYPRLELWLTIGPEDDRRLFVDFQEHLRRLGILDRVRMLGRVPQDAMWELYGKSDLMVYPSYCESFGFAMLEAMGSGLPVVAADTKTNREICGEGANFFAPFNARECADRISKVLDSDLERTALRAGGAQRIDGYDWSWQRYATEFTSILHHLKL